MNQRLLRILGGKTEHYPYELEKHYPRILETIMSLWDDETMDGYFTELLVSNRGERSGFPPAIAAEIMHLSLVHAAQEPPEKSKGIWDAAPNSFVNFTPRRDWADMTEAAQSEIAQLGLPCTPEGFFEAAETGNRAALALFIEAQKNTEFRDNRGWTPLMAACFNGWDETVTMLIHHDADVNAIDLGGNTALHWAAFSGHIPCLNLLISRQAKINAGNNFDWTPLMQATARNHGEMVARLIECGADLDKADNDGYTALHKAVASGNEQIARLLLQNGADKKRPTDDGDTPDSLAVKNKDARMIRILADLAAI